MFPGHWSYQVQTRIILVTIKIYFRLIRGDKYAWMLAYQYTYKTGILALRNFLIKFQLRRGDIKDWWVNWFTYHIFDQIFYENKLENLSGITNNEIYLIKIDKNCLRKKVNCFFNFKKTFHNLKIKIIKNHCFQFFLKIRKIEW